MVRLKRTLGFGFAAIVIVWAIVQVLQTVGWDRGPRVFVVEDDSPARPIPHKPLNDLASGDEVEVTGILVEDRMILEALKVPGIDLSRIAPESEGKSFSVASGTHARVLEQDADAVHIAILEGQWVEREGWVFRKDVRLPPSR